jgi:hypothetical protein
VRTKTQDPKYDIEDGKLINSATGTPIPEDEPVFLFRAKDVHALGTIHDYSKRVYESITSIEITSSDHLCAINRRLNDFEKFKQDHPERMKQPDTALKL